jgi:aminoglycoside N3'-acetyltransferase
MIWLLNGELSMGENDVVLSSIKPWASGDITAMAHKLGIECGDTVIVHCRMSSLGWVSGRGGLTDLDR